MNKRTRLLPYLIVSISIAIMLSFLPDIDKNIHRNQEEVTNMRQNQFVFSNETLVDAFVQLSFHLPIQRIEWNGSVLSVDFKKDGPPFSNEVLEDLFRLCHFSFAYTDNVDKLLVRILYEHRMGEGGTWLLTMDANRADWSLEEAEQVRFSDRTLKAFLEKYTNLQYSKRWLFQENV